MGQGEERGKGKFCPFTQPCQNAMPGTKAHAENVCPGHTGRVRRGQELPCYATWQLCLGCQGGGRQENGWGWENVGLGGKMREGKVVVGVCVGR